MSQTANDLPKLFRSLEHNGAEPRSANSNGSTDAEHRWPLLKAMHPKEPQPTPALTAQELQRWQPLGSNEQARPTTPLSPPGLGDILALSLKKMSTRANAEAKKPENNSQPTAAAQTPTPTADRAPPAELTRGFQPPVPATMPEVKIAEAEVTLGGILSKKDTAVELIALNHTLADDSLKSVFSRLEGSKKETKPVANTEKRSSYLGRLGRK